MAVVVPAAVAAVRNPSTNQCFFMFLAARKI
jgi:hypothetical protein